VTERRPEGRVWIDGAEVPADAASFPPEDPGVFETLAVREGRPLELAEHLARLSDGASGLGVPLRGLPEIAAACESVASGVRAPRGWLKVLATLSGRSAVLAGSADPDEEGRPVTAILVRWSRSHDDPLARIKTIARLHSLLAEREARARGADEGIWRNDRGHLAESGSANVFVVARGRLYTPSERDGILPGITRAIAIRAARSLGLVVHEGKVRLARLERADEAFLTSSVRGVRPIVRFEGAAVGRGTPGPIATAIRREVERLRGGRSRVDAFSREEP
jgi:branched-subunit amino acid aminotransferase/4-amino-4-deoxychorismate lyase